MQLVYQLFLLDFNCWMCEWIQKGICVQNVFESKKKGYPIKVTGFNGNGPSCSLLLFISHICTLGFLRWLILHMISVLSQAQTCPWYAYLLPFQAWIQIFTSYILSSTLSNTSCPGKLRIEFTNFHGSWLFLPMACTFYPYRSWNAKRAPQRNTKTNANGSQLFCS